MESLKFVDLFAGLGGFHKALSDLGHECIFASEVEPSLQAAYIENFPSMKGRLFGDIREHGDEIPNRFDILCAGFPCQPFSKSGEQLGTKDETQGTLFHEIVRILRRWHPPYVILENVGNFERHDKGKTWGIVRQQLESLGYSVRGTAHVTPLPDHDWRDRSDGRANRRSRVDVDQQPGIGLISPHHFGHPHHRERFFIVASKGPLPANPFPQGDRRAKTSLTSVVQKKGELSAGEKRETALTEQQLRCIQHWDEFLHAIPKDLLLPTIPLWSDELDAKYPFETRSPWATAPIRLGQTIPGHRFPRYTRREEMLKLLPSYAREEVDEFRDWKKHYIRANREWWRQVKPSLSREWIAELRRFPSSLRKLEWNVKGGERDIWAYVLQFRPSGLRVKRYDSCPALVAMTATQIPILGPERRFLTRTEGLRLQGFPDDFALPASRTAAFKALGNGVHVEVVRRIAKSLLTSNTEHGALVSIPIAR